MAALYSGVICPLLQGIIASLIKTGEADLKNFV